MFRPNPESHTWYEVMENEHTRKKEGGSEKGMEGLSKEKGGNIYSRIRSSFVPVIINPLNQKGIKHFIYRGSLDST